MRDAFGRGVGAVRGRETVVDVKIAERGHRLRQLRVVLFLAEMEARVLEDADIAGQHGGDGPLGLGPLAILDEADRAAGEAVERKHQLGGRHVGPHLALGPAEMRQQEHDRAAVAQLQHRRQHRAEPRVVGDLGAVHRHVEVDANEHLLAGQVLRQVVQGLEIAHLPARMFTNVRSNTRARAGRGEVHANAEHMQPGKRTAHDSAIMETEPCRTALFISRACPSPRRCRPCGSRSPIHCRTS